jgi:photosystem II stability/assembly factor-like uncharacterized protein
MKIFITVLISIFYSVVLSAQSLSPWVQTNSPIAFRYDDISFVNKDTGWAVCAYCQGLGNTGMILHTKDGGNSWTTQLSKSGVYMRCVEFSSPKRGFAGSVGQGGVSALFKTTDGGTTWTDISSVITGTNKGICGICSVDTNVTYAVGVWSSPAYIMKTTNGGDKWSQIDMSAYASRLVDVQFKDALNGYVAGQSNISSEGAVILKTDNGGLTWTKVFTNNMAASYVWKLQNLDDTHWYASVESGVGAWKVFLKSTNGGNSWTSHNVSFYSVDNKDRFQLVGFKDTLRGWTGGRVLFQTTDGGTNWSAIDSNAYSQLSYTRYNRFQRVDQTTSYITGRYVYKLSPTWTAIKTETSSTEYEPELKIFPNPSKGAFTISLKVPGKTMYNLRIINSSNTIVWEDIGQKPAAGEYTFKANGTFPAGIYYVYVMTNEGTATKKLVIQ